MSVTPPIADMVESEGSCPLYANSRHRRLVLRYGDLGGGDNQYKSQYDLNCPDRERDQRPILLAQPQSANPLT